MKQPIIVIQAAILGLLLCACPTDPIIGPQTLLSDTAISELTVNGVAANVNGSSFGATVPHETSEIIIAFVPATGATAVLGNEPGSRFERIRISIGTTWFTIVITAQDGTSTASYTLIVTRDPEILPDSIALVSLVADEENVGPRPTFTWVKSAGAKYWQVFFAEGAYSEDPSPSMAPASDFLWSPSWTPPTNLNPSMSYGWKVIPYDASGTALASSEDRVFRTGFLPDGPSSLVVTQVAEKPHISLTWTASTGAKKYKVFRNNGSIPVFISSNAETLTWIDGSPNAGVNTYSVKGSNDFGDSLVSAHGSGTPSDGGPAVIIIK